jgi:hypothetical protein
MRALRVFLADSSGADWTELTSGHGQTTRLAAPDLQQAQRARHRILAGGRHSDDVAVILDIVVFPGADFRSARKGLAMLVEESHASTLHYAGTLDGLAGLVGDIFVAGVADGVTLIPAAHGLDARAWAEHVVARLSRRLPVARAA